MTPNEAAILKAAREWWEELQNMRVAQGDTAIQNGSAVPSQRLEECMSALAGSLMADAFDRDPNKKKVVKQ